MLNRLLNKWYANIFGYFWLPCPRCKKYMGGHEWKNDYMWTQEILEKEETFTISSGKGICNDCANELTMKVKKEEKK